jgi:glutathione synthase/RimK-type ligase-like ATP-grasp enzyme
MYGFITRKNWEQTTVKAISKFMSTKTEVRTTGEKWNELPDVVIRWGCTADVPTKSVINKASSIHLVANKSGFRQVIRDNFPDDIPKTWFPTDSILYTMKNPPQFPVIVRPSSHKQGKDFHVCKDAVQLEKALELCGEGAYISQFEEKAKEYRVVVMQGRIAFVCQKVPNNKSLNTWGLAANWSTIKWGEWPLEAVKKAIRVHGLSDLTFSAVDIIENKQGKSFVCEANTAPELGGDYWAEKMAMVFDYIVENGKEPIATDLEANNWKNFIHPALSEKAA